MYLIDRYRKVTPEMESLARYVDSDATPDDVVRLDESMQRTVAILRGELRSVEPSEQFIGNLRLRLVAMADQRAPVAALEEPVAPWRQPRYLAIGAAGLVSAAAVIAFVARSRARQQAIAA